ncbi:MAG: Cna B-type domain-containing protein [Eggerthellaceae bacterium]|nr:Cna B-type domain-containing protein [Eggerthellaceae bacterium]
MDKALTYRKMGLKAVLACMLAAVLACVAWAALPTTAYAADDFGSITITFTGSDTHGAIVGMESRVYKVASFTDASGTEMELDGDYKQLANILGWKDAKAASEQDASWWQKKAKTLDCYIRLHAYEPHATAITDENGTVVFDRLSDGLYLVVNLGDGIHRFDSSLVTIGGQKEYHQVVEPKNVTPAMPYTDIKVVKHWEGNITDPADTPQNVIVQLMQGDEAYGDPIELNDSNNWTYTWSGLDDSKVYYWDVVEINPPNRYSISIDENDGEFTITNTLLDHPPYNMNFEVSISKQDVNNSSELPGAKLQIYDNSTGELAKDSSGEALEWTSTEQPRSVRLVPGEYTLREDQAPLGYQFAESIDFRLNEDGTLERKVNGSWTSAADGKVVMQDAPLDEDEELTPPPAYNPPTPSPTPSTPPTTVNQTPSSAVERTASATPASTASTAASAPAKLPQTGQLWWPVPVLLIAGIVAIGAGRVVAARSRR